MTAQRGGFVLGLIVGLLVGLALALGVALYITKAPVPFVNKVPQRTAEQDSAETERNKNWDPNAPLAGKGGKSQAASAPVAPAPAAATPPVAAAEPPHPASAAAKAAPRDPSTILSGAPSTDAAAEPFVYFVQAGAFSRSDEAEQQRAKLAMLGLVGKVTEREQSGRVVYRVRVGPYEARDEAEGVQNRLQAASIDTRLVRVER